MIFDKLLDLAQRLEMTSTSESFWHQFEHRMAALGITRFIYLSVSNSGDDLFVRANIDLSAAIPDGYRDPFLEYCCNSYAITRTGIEYSQDYLYLGDQDRALIKLAAEKGFRSGFGIPVRVKGSARFGGFNLGTDLSKSAFEEQFDQYEAAFQTFCMVAHRKIEELMAQPTQTTTSEELTQLSKREREVFLLFANGKTRAQCAQTLGISAHTVSTHLKNSYEKLGISNKVEAARLLTKPQG